MFCIANSTRQNIYIYEDNNTYTCKKMCIWFLFVFVILFTIFRETLFGQKMDAKKVHIPKLVHW